MAKIVSLVSPNRPRTTIGQMRQEIKVLTYGDSPFGAHSLDRTYVEVATVRARVTNISGSASREGIGLDANITHTIVIRKPEFELTTENMIEWIHPGTNEHLRVRQARPVGKTSNDPRMQFVMLLCESQGLVDAFNDPSPESAPTLSGIAVPDVTGILKASDVIYLSGTDVPAADVGVYEPNTVDLPSRECVFRHVSSYMHIFCLHPLTYWNIGPGEGTPIFNVNDGTVTEIPPETGWLTSATQQPADVLSKSCYFETQDGLFVISFSDNMYYITEVATETKWFERATLYGTYNPVAGSGATGLLVLTEGVL